jgi:membrane associated rhomboid family serine protease
MPWEDRPYYRDDTSFRMRFGFTPPTPVAMWVMIACLVTFVGQAIAGDFRTWEPGAAGLSKWGALTFEHYRAFTQPWRWITYQYLHGDAMHIFFNLIGIYFFVPPLERIWGGRATFLFYTAGGIAAGVLFGVIRLFLPPGPYLVGASGSIFAALGAMALLFPQTQILILFVFPMSIRLLALLLGLLWFLIVISSGNPSAAAHLGGLVFGFVAPYYGKDAWSNLVRRFRRSRERRQIAAEQEESAMIDRILQKVHDHGMNSLSRSERKALQRATDRQRRADMARATRRVGS